MPEWLTTGYIRERNGRALFTAVLMAAGVGYLYLKPSPDVVETQHLDGVVEKRLCDAAPGAHDICMIRFNIPNGETVSILMPAPLPRSGDAVPLVVERLSDDTRRFQVDMMAWERRRLR